MEKEISISYEKIENIFYLGKKEKVKFSIDIALPSGDVIIDVGFDGFIKGIEIFNASEFFSIKPEILEKIKKANFSVVYTPTYTAITITLINARETIKQNLAIPYNKRLALAA